MFESGSKSKIMVKATLLPIGGGVAMISPKLYRYSANSKSANEEQSIMATLSAFYI